MNEFVNFTAYMGGKILSQLTNLFGLLFILNTWGLTTMMIVFAIGAILSVLERIQVDS